MSTSTQLHNDLRYVFHSFPLDCLYHLRSNHNRLIRRSYFDHEKNGCLMNLLSETLPASRRIHSRESLTRYFSDGDENAASYQPAKWIVRLWDERICSVVKIRYGNDPSLTVDVIIDVLEKVIAERELAARPSAKAELMKSATAPLTV